MNQSDRLKRIMSGKEKYSLRDFQRDFYAEIMSQKDLRKEADIWFGEYLNMMYLLAIDKSEEEIKELMKTTLRPTIPEDLIICIMEDTKSRFGDRIKLLNTIIFRKIIDFIRMGLSEDAAIMCTNDWLRSELD